MYDALMFARLVRWSLPAAVALFWAGFGTLLPYWGAWLAVGISGALIYCWAFLTYQPLRQGAPSWVLRWWPAGVFPIIGIPLGIGLLAPSQKDQVQDKLIALEKAANENSQLLSELAERVMKDHPNATEIVPLPRAPKSNKTVSLTLGQIHVELTLLGSDEGSWRYRIDVLDSARLHDRGSEIIVSPGEPVALVTGTDASLLVSVATLPTGERIPWVGFVKPVTREAVHTLFRVGETILGAPNSSSASDPRAK
ncbi:MAG TPA: hypothetical protein VJV75_06220 [Candidatus Polarisedimenticolia bacterium]|nr:hypothetical protein [Candidatus Polarisedimenticolia bacterium]